MRVFVSSVIFGFEQFRNAARKAVELTGNTPIMAEDFGARPDAPQRACLDGVRDSDIYLLLIGSRYGASTTGGVSPTEEEFDEAQRLRLPVLAFRTSESIDPDQDEFLRRVSPSWERGATYAHFTTPDELKDEIVKSLSRAGGFTTGMPARAADLDAWLTQLSSDREDVGVALAFVPAGGGRIVGLGRIDNLGAVVADLVEKAGLISHGTLHVRERAVEIGVESERDHTYGLVDVHDDLSCGIGVGLRNERREFGSMDFHYIDRAKLVSVLAGSLHLVSDIVTTVDDRATIRAGYAQCRLWGLRHKEIADLPGQSVTSFTFPADAGDEMLFPSEPLSLQLRELVDADHLAPILLRALERQVADARRQRH